MHNAARPLPVLSVLLFVLLGVGGCGDDASTTTPVAENGPSIETRRMAKRSGPLGWRDRPLDVGATAPAFDGLPEGDVLLVFYRGHW